MPPQPLRAFLDPDERRSVPVAATTLGEAAAIDLVQLAIINRWLTLTLEERAELKRRVRVRLLEDGTAPNTQRRHDDQRRATLPFPVRGKDVR